MSNERKTFLDCGAKVHRFLVHLMGSEHAPKPIDDLCGLHALALDVGQDLDRSSGVARSAAIIIRPAWALWIIEVKG